MKIIEALIVPFIGLIVTVCLTAFALYCKNVYEATELDFKAPYVAEAFRVAGIIVFPLGILLGATDIEDGEHTDD